MTTRKNQPRGFSKPENPSRSVKFTPPKNFRPDGVTPKNVVTDHALVRYFERVLHLDVEAIRAGILTPEQEAQITSGFASELKLAPGVRAIIKNGAVVTIK